MDCAAVVKESGFSKQQIGRGMTLGKMEREKSFIISCLVLILGKTKYSTALEAIYC